VVSALDQISECLGFESESYSSVWKKSIKLQLRVRVPFNWLTKWHTYETCLREQTVPSLELAWSNSRCYIPSGYSVHKAVVSVIKYSSLMSFSSTSLHCVFINFNGPLRCFVDPGGRAAQGVTPKPLHCRERGFKLYWEHQWSSFVFDVRCVGSGL